MTVLLVAAGPGLGRAIATALGAEHGPVGLIARRQEPLDALALKLAESGVAAQGFVGDITDEVGLRAAIAAARAAHGPPTVVVFNASLWVPGPPSRLSVDLFRTGLATGLTAAVVTVTAVAADLLAAAPNSTLLFTGSGAGLTPSPADIGLGIQKAGLRHLALATAQELGPSGVQVSMVTIRGTLAAGTAFDPDRIASVYEQLARPGLPRPAEVTVTTAGPDWAAQN